MPFIPDFKKVKVVRTFAMMERDLETMSLSNTEKEMLTTEMQNLCEKYIKENNTSDDSWIARAWYGAELMKGGFGYCEPDEERGMSLLLELDEKGLSISAAGLTLMGSYIYKRLYQPGDNPLITKESALSFFDASDRILTDYIKKSGTLDYRNIEEYIATNHYRALMAYLWPDVCQDDPLRLAINAMKYNAPHGCYLYGLFYDEGTLFPRDRIKAAQYFLLASIRNNRYSWGWSNIGEAIKQATESCHHDINGELEYLHGEKSIILDIEKKALRDWLPLMKKADGEQDSSNEVTQTSSGEVAQPTVSAKAKNLIAELHSLTGIQNVKQQVGNLLNYQVVQRKRKYLGFKTKPMVLNCVFSGPPGTGKTTVAKLYAKILAEHGFLSKGQLVIASRATLIGQYIGDAERNTTDAVNRALGGVLFIDEAYALSDTDYNRDYGNQVISTLVKLIDDHKDDLVVIVAGYKDKMKQFIAYNPGLESRFPYNIGFESYSDDELIEIFKNMCAAEDYQADSEVENKLRTFLAGVSDEKKDVMGNARWVRNVLEKASVKQAARIIAQGLDSKQEIIKITVDDIDLSDNSEEPKQKIGFI